MVHHAGDSCAMGKLDTRSGTSVGLHHGSGKVVISHSAGTVVERPQPPSIAMLQNVLMNTAKAKVAKIRVALNLSLNQAEVQP